jgi:sulfate/thiosulfate-binding protein
MRRSELRRLRALAVLGAAVAALAVAGCGGSSDSNATSSGGAASSSSGSAGASSPTTKLNLVGYSTPKKAYDALTAAFAQTSTGKGVGFSESFGASGSQSRAVDSGQPADVVAFSTTPDMTRLVKDKLVSSSWDANPEKGFSSDSVVVFVVRKGNPKGIENWSDLVKPGVQVLTPNPFSSGSARWNIMAAYGAALKQGDTSSQAESYLSDLLSHVVVQDSSASSELETFLAGKGDVLLDYEDDAIAAKKAGEPIDYVVPPQTILIQNPIAVVEGSHSSGAAQAFVDYLLSPAGQTLWGQLGYRPVLPSIAAKFSFPDPPGLFTISYVGGWTKVKTEFFDPSTGIVTQIEQHLGISTSSG